MEFSLLCQITTSAKASYDRLYQKEELLPYNRYTDILTYDETRVKLKDSADTDYINACYVDVSVSLSHPVYRAPLDPIKRLLRLRAPNLRLSSISGAW